MTRVANKIGLGSDKKRNLVGSGVAFFFRLPDLVSLNFISIGILSDIVISLDLVAV